LKKRLRLHWDSRSAHTRKHTHTFFQVGCQRSKPVTVVLYREINKIRRQISVTNQFVISLVKNLISAKPHYCEHRQRSNRISVIPNEIRDIDWLQIVSRIEIKYWNIYQNEGKATGKKAKRNHRNEPEKHFIVHTKSQIRDKNRRSISEKKLYFIPFPSKFSFFYWFIFFNPFTVHVCWFFGLSWGF
jgi:hypothetical protein